MSTPLDESTTTETPANPAVAEFFEAFNNWISERHEERRPSPRKPQPNAEHGEWHAYQPCRDKDSKEPQEWDDFMSWCDVWGGWTQRTVPIVRIKDEDRRDAPKDSDWHLRVYAGRK